MKPTTKLKSIFLRVFFISLILFFNIQSWTKASEIMDLEIEGISVGDSALNFYTESEIKNNIRNYYKDKKFTPVQATNFPFYEIYDAVDFDFKTGDENYTIYSLSGVITYVDKDINECYKRMDEIDKNINTVLNNFKREDKETWKHRADPTGKSTFTDIYYESSEGTVTITCYDFSKEEEEKGSGDYFAVMISLNEWVSFMRNNPYN